MGSLAKQLSGQCQEKLYAKGGKVAPAKVVKPKAASKVAAANIPVIMKKGGKCK